MFLAGLSGISTAYVALFPRGGGRRDFYGNTEPSLYSRHCGNIRRPGQGWLGKTILSRLAG
jgi:hypothetical protein